MKNTTYFHTVVRDAYSASSSSSSLQSPQRVEIQPQESAKPKVKGFRVSSILGFKQKVVRDDGMKLPHPNFKNFSLEELKTATGNLLTEYSLGVDGHDREFKGWISEHDFTPAEPGNGIAVVDKLLDTKKFGIREDEARYLGQLSHPNLVKLFGCCLYEERLYVFEFMPRTLGDHLFERTGEPSTSIEPSYEGCPRSSKGTCISS